MLQHIFMQFYPNNVLEKLGFEQIREATLHAAQSERSCELIEGLQPTSIVESIVINNYSL